MQYLAQRGLFCVCGHAFPVVAGLCRRCYSADWRSRSYYGGFRDQVLARDGCCQICGGKSGLCVHHRRPSNNDDHLLIAVCRACHARLYRRHQLPGWAPPVLVALWEEQHPGWALQLQLVAV